MRYQIEIQHPELTLCKIVRDDEIVEEKLGETLCQFTVAASPDTVSVWFEPWKIKPVIRVNGILINYALAQVDQYDHKIDIVLDSDFVERYRQRDIDFRIKTVFGDRDIDDYVYDSVIGHGRMHQDVLDKIRKIINES